MTEQDWEIIAIKIATSLKESKADKIEIMNISAKSKMAKFLVLCSCKTSEQAKLTYHQFADFCGDYDLNIFATDGINKGEWIVCDLQDIIVHIFTPEAREKYNLEKLWKDNKMKEIKL